MPRCPLYTFRRNKPGLWRRVLAHACGRYDFRLEGMTQSDICIAGAGIVGLSLALELHARGLSVIVLDAGGPMQQASTAAAGMLAADDPHNPSELSALSHLSLSLYPDFL